MAAEQVFYRDYVNPFFRAQGFVRKGRTYRHVASNGDVAVVNFQGSVGSTRDRYVFYINVAVKPKPWLEWEAHNNPESAGKEPDAYSGMYWGRVIGDWSVTDEAALPEAWQKLHGPLSNEVTHLLALLDRANFIAYIEGGGQRVFPWNEVALATLLADSPDTAKLEQQLAVIAANPRLRDFEFPDWLRNRNATRGQGTAQ